KVFEPCAERITSDAKSLWSEAFRKAWRCIHSHQQMGKIFSAAGLGVLDQSRQLVALCVSKWKTLGGGRGLVGCALCRSKGLQWTASE
ncbi:MAG: hypothetical protein RR729_15535, partial [Comamonas sp.]